ncbi:hypothetical protein AVEN_164812-1, partial [Araneus ventricosus]
LALSASILINYFDSIPPLTSQTTGSSATGSKTSLFSCSACPQTPKRNLPQCIQWMQVTGKFGDDSCTHSEPTN